jgi:hypothetical protein
MFRAALGIDDETKRYQARYDSPQWAEAKQNSWEAILLRARIAGIKRCGIE